MTTHPPARRRRQALHRLVLMTMGLLPVSCSAQTPSCSDEQAIATVKELILKDLRQDYQLAAVYDLAASRFDLRAIRTVGSDERSSTCRGELAIQFEPNSELKAAMAKPSGNATASQMLSAFFGNTSRSLDLHYSVERTDDGKDIYVSIETR